MEDLLEALFEGLIEFIFEGLTSTSESKRVPILLRILAALLVLLLFGGVSGLMVFVGIMLMKENHIIAGIFMFVIAALVWVYAIRKFVKVFRSRQS